MVSTIFACNYWRLRLPGRQPPCVKCLSWTNEAELHNTSQTRHLAATSLLHMKPSEVPRLQLTAHGPLLLLLLLSQMSLPVVIRLYLFHGWILKKVARSGLGAGWYFGLIALNTCTFSYLVIVPHSIWVSYCVKAMYTRSGSAEGGRGGRCFLKL